VTDSPAEQLRRQEMARTELQAAQLVEASDPQTALLHLLRAEQLDARNTATLLLIGRTQLRLNLALDAVDSLERMLRLSPGHQEALSTLAYGQVLLGNFDIARERAQQALGLDPDDRTAREVLADCHAAVKDYAACLKELNHLTVVLTEGPLARVTQKAAYCLFRLGHFKSALTATSTLLENGFESEQINAIYLEAQQKVREEIALKYPNLTLWQKFTNRLNDSMLLRVHLDSTRGMESLQVRYDDAQVELRETGVAMEEHERRADELDRKANTDQLTGLPNRHCFNDHWLPKVSASRQCGIVAFDLDFFKYVNSVHEHAGGDRVLAKAANIGGRIFQQPDAHLFRFGGEEFYAVAFLPRQGVLDLAERFRAALERAAAAELAAEGLTLLWPEGDDKAAWPANHARLVPRVLTASVGVAFWPKDGEDVEAVMKAADKACYAAKHGGRNRVVVYEAAMTGTDERSPANAVFEASVPRGFRPDSARKERGAVRRRGTAPIAEGPEEGVLSVEGLLGDKDPVKPEGRP